MILAFRTERLRSICEDEDLAIEEIGAAPATALRQRLADLRAAWTINDLPVGRPQVSGEHSELLTFELDGDVRMVWTVNSPHKPSRTVHGAVDRAPTGRIQLLRFEGE
jgi:hypothetical protein